MAGRGVRERGASALEYIGAVVLAAALVAAIALAIVKNDRVHVAVCKAVHSILQEDGSCGPATSPGKSDKDFQPDKCKQNETGESYNSKVKIFFIEIGDNAGFIETQYSDGTVELTATDGGSLGATGGFGADASFGKLSAGAKVNFGGGLEFAYGSTWSFPGADGQKNADAFKGKLNDYLAQQVALEHGGSCWWWCKDEPRKPDSTMSSIKLTAEVSGTLGIDLTNKTGSGEHKKGESIPAAEVVGSIGGGSEWAVDTDTATGDVTYTTTLSLDSSVSGTLWTSTWGLAGARDVAMSITKNQDGKVTGVKFVSTAEGSINAGTEAAGGHTSGDKKGNGDGDASAGSSSEASRASVVTTSLTIDPSDTQAQQTVADWLGGDNDYSFAGAISAGSIDPSLGSTSDPFQQLMHDRATVSAVTYDNVKDVDEFGLNVKVGVALGFDFSLEKDQSHAVAASYLGAPDASGARHGVPYTDCVK